MKKNDLIFVYGTLRKGQRADLSSGLYQHGVTFVGTDEITGRLYHLGAFPGLKIDGTEYVAEKPAVFGEVWLIRHASITAILDSYEGYHSDDPSSGLYDRTVVETRSGKKVWVYTYNSPVLEEQLIVGGDWCKDPTLILTQSLRRRA